MPEYRKVKREGTEVLQKKCQSECGKWHDEADFHWRTPEHKARSSRCRWCAAKAQRDLRKRKKGLQPRRPRGRFGIVDPNVERGRVRSSREAAATQRANVLKQIDNWAQPKVS